MLCIALFWSNLPLHQYHTGFHHSECVCARALPHGIFSILLLLLLPAATTIDDNDYCDEPDYTCDNADNCSSGSKVHGGCKEDGTKMLWWKDGGTIDWIVLMVVLMTRGKMYAHAAWLRGWCCIERTGSCWMRCRCNILMYLWRCCRETGCRPLEDK